MPRCDFDARIMSGFEIIRRVSEAPSSPSLPHAGCIKQKKKNSPGLSRAKMRRPQTTTTDKNATAHNQYHVTVCHERFAPRTGGSTKCDEGVFLQVLLSYQP